MALLADLSRITRSAALSMALWTAFATPALAAPTQAAMDSASWSRITTIQNANAGEVGVWKATVDGVECFRGTATTTDVSPEQLLDVVTDVEGAKRWSSAGITDAKLLSRSPGKIAYYQYLDVPGWTMAADRFWFLTADVLRTPERSHLQWTPLPPGGPHAELYEKVKTDHPSAVEPTVNVGSWLFEAGTDGVKMVYSICTLPGGSIPVAIQNAATRRTLPDTLGDVVREARRR